MAESRLTLRKLVFAVCSTPFHFVSGAPGIAFPFNSQVPTVARAGRAYNFQFSKSTFAQEGTSFTYSISDGPAWLSLDGATRSLSGTPGRTDIGTPTFTITAAYAGGAAHMACTLVVSADPAPQLEGSILKELAATANLSNSQPPTVTILPSTPFRFQFQRNSFIDIVRRQLFYYATLTDHTPLPAWLQFDQQTITFAGTTPQLSAFPQSWDIDLIASDVAGFAGSRVSFTIAIDTQQLVFVPEQVTINVFAGIAVNFSTLPNTLFRNGEQLALGDLRSANATVPGWLSFDPMTLALSGTPPSDVQDRNCTVHVEDRLGDQATAILQLIVGNPTIFAGSIGTLTVRAAQIFAYHIPSTLFSTEPVDVIVSLPMNARWLHFDPATRILSGRAPSQTTPSSIHATLGARSPTESKVQTQTFTVELLPSIPKTSASHSGSPPPIPTHQLSGDKSATHLNSGIVAAVVLGVLLAACLLVAFLYLIRRRREGKQWGGSGDETNRRVSQPTIPSDGDGIIVTTEVQRDVEKAAEGNEATDRLRESDPAPRLGLDVFSDVRSRAMKWSKRFSRISRVSSLGNGEDAIRGDSNIPILGGESMATHTPHHSFSVSTEMARASLPLGEVSPTKRALRRVRAKLPGTQNVGLGIDAGETKLSPRPRSENAAFPKRTASSGATSAAVDRSSMGSFSTKGTSVLSARPSDFPRPPPSRSAFASRRARLGMARADLRNRESIRAIERSDSITDERPMEEKRQSFIRNRASTGIASPLFSHGSRLSSSVPYSVPFGNRRSQHGNIKLDTFSKCSATEPATGPTSRIEGKQRFVFAPNFPRAMTKSILATDDETAADRDSSSFYTTDEESSEPEYVTELHLPRHLRTWVVPGEASPTPPPAPPASRQPSRLRQGSPLTGSINGPRALWQRRLREQSASPVATGSSAVASSRAKQARRSRLSEPLSLVSNDSVSRAKQQRAGRPMGEERMRGMSGVVQDEAEDARPGSEMFEALESAGLMPPGTAESRGASQRSNASGPAFL